MSLTDIAAVLRLILDHLILDHDLKSQCVIFDLDHFLTWSLILIFTPWLGVYYFCDNAHL